MKLLAKRLAWTSAFLLIASFATCHFGVQHEINKIPPEIRARMSDFDWIGIRWIAWGGAIFILACILALTASAYWIIQWSDRRKTNG
jgi:hypothetical protein